MKTRRKITFRQTLNPFLGFGWYTGMDTPKNQTELKFNSNFNFKLVK
ncbi:hypothetical protein [Algibacter mikhailovii]|nr:hypothetical protein [Algibacter mikhailovii]